MSKVTRKTMANQFQKRAAIANINFICFAPSCSLDHSELYSPCPHST
jgi:hypothetical protein